MKPVVTYARETRMMKTQTEQKLLNFVDNIWHE
jgi:hypothetical protein